MARSSEPIETLQRPLGSVDAAPAAGTLVQPSDTPTSPARSDKSSDSEGKPVRKQLEDTTLEPHVSAPKPGSDLTMGDATNGADPAGEQSGSGSESGRGRLRRKRSREDFEDEEKPQGKKVQESHTRKKSRDLTIADDQEGDLSMVSVDNAEDTTVNPASRDPTPEDGKTEKKGDKIISPKNKRTIDQTRSGEDITSAGENNVTEVEKTASVVGEERDTKRQKDADSFTSAKKASTTQIPPGSGFANSSAASPFAVLTPKSQDGSDKEKEKEKDGLPQTSDDKFKASGFGSFAASSASPFGAVSKTSASPFGAAPSTTKLSSFAAPSSGAKPSGFGTLGANTSKSTFGSSTSVTTNGGSVFGGSLGASAFGGLGGNKPGSLGFGTPGAQAITGLKQKSDRPFGQQADEESENEEDDGEGGDDDSATEQDTEKPQTKFSSQAEPVETGEEGEHAEWVGRAKLYTMAGEGKERGWRESGMGTFKLNITDDEPTRARFILRADATHRLLLNAAVTRNLKFGDADGKAPTDGRLLFNTPTSDGKLEMHLVRMKSEKATQLWEVVDKIKDSL